MIIEISVAALVLIFAILVIFIIRLLVTVQKTLHRVDETLMHVDRRIEPLTEEAAKLIKTSNEIIRDVHENAVHPLVRSVSHIGQALDDITAPLDKPEHLSPQQQAKHVLPPKVEVQEWIEWATLGCQWVVLGLALWKKVNKRR